VSRFELAAALAEVPDYYGQQCRSSKLHASFFFLLTDTQSTAEIIIKGHCPSLKLKHEPLPWSTALGYRVRKVGRWTES
jgi:hypothetical protein